MREALTHTHERRRERQQPSLCDPENHAENPTGKIERCEFWKCTFLNMTAHAPAFTADLPAFNGGPGLPTAQFRLGFLLITHGPNGRGAEYGRVSEPG